jgi:hypothetical protein
MRLILATLVVLLTGVFIVTGCNVNKYDTYDYCQLSDGQYQIVISIAHDSSEPSNLKDPREYDKLCTEFVGAPDVHISRPKP